MSNPFQVTRRQQLAAKTAMQAEEEEGEHKPSKKRKGKKGSRKGRGKKGSGKGRGKKGSGKCRGKKGSGKGRGKKAALRTQSLQRKPAVPRSCPKAVRF